MKKDKTGLWTNPLLLNQNVISMIKIQYACSKGRRQTSQIQEKSVNIAVLKMGFLL